jgi:hypothetical protein
MDFDERIYTQFAGKSHLIPFNAVQILQNDAYGDPYRNFVYYNLEKESSLRLTPVTRPHYKLGAVFVGWNVEASCYISNNEKSFQEEQQTIMGYLQGQVIEARFLLGNAVADWVFPNSEYTPPTRINSTNSLMIKVNSKRLCALFEMETVEYRLRNIIRIKGFAQRSDVTYE